MIDAKELKQTIDMLDKADAANWNADGTPNLEVVRRLMGNDEVSAADVTAATAPGSGTVIKPATKASTETIKPATLPKEGAMHSVDADADKQDGIGEGKVPDPVEVMKATAAQAVADKEKLQAAADDKKRALAALQAEVEADEKNLGKLERVIEANTEQLSHAEMVKRIQKQTQERLALQAANAAKAREIIKGPDGVRTFASPLDASLASGAKRSKVLIGGKMFEAPHPRSPEGVRAYGNWVHSGQKRPA